MAYKRGRFIIIHEDEDILAINKAAGILTIPDRYNHAEKSLITSLREEYPELMVVHRLDKDTSGIILFAKNKEAHRSLNMQFDDQSIKKIYHAVVGGIVPKDEISVDIPLIQNPGKGGGVLPSPKGKESLSIVKVLKRFRNSTFIEVDLVTGRQHQLRAHVAAIGHPLLIDNLYGENSEFYLSSIKKKFNLKKHDVEQPIISRITMHANSINFLHPSKNIRLTLSAEYPKDFRVLLQLLEKYASID